MARVTSESDDIIDIRADTTCVPFIQHLLHSCISSALLNSKFIESQLVFCCCLSFTSPSQRYYFQAKIIDDASVQVNAHAIKFQSYVALVQQADLITTTLCIHSSCVCVYDALRREHIIRVDNN